MLAVWEPRLSSCMSWPADVSKILIRVPCGNTTWTQINNNRSKQHNNWRTSVLTRNIIFFFCQFPSALAWLTFSDAVAIRVPCRFRAMQHSAPSWAGISTGGFSVLARSTICTWPEWVPGNASRELLLLGHSTQRPEENREKVGYDVKPCDINNDNILWKFWDWIWLQIKLMLHGFNGCFIMWYKLCAPTKAEQADLKSESSNRLDWPLGL